MTIIRSSNISVSIEAWLTHLAINAGGIVKTFGTLSGVWIAVLGMAIAVTLLADATDQLVVDTAVTRSA